MNILQIAAVIYAIISGAAAMYTAISVRIGSVFYEVGMAGRTIIFILTLLFWPIILVINIIVWIIDRINGR